MRLLYFAALYNFKQKQENRLVFAAPEASAGEKCWKVKMKNKNAGRRSTVVALRQLHQKEIKHLCTAYHASRYFLPIIIGSFFFNFSNISTEYIFSRFASLLLLFLLLFFLF